MKKIYIISLSASNRRANIAKQLDNLAIDNYEFIDAFDARYLPETLLGELFDRERFFQLYQRYPSNGEIGCTLSHISVIKKMRLEGISDAIILEDDAILASNFIDFYHDKIETAAHFILLGYSKVSKTRAFYHYIKRRLVSDIVIKKRYSFGGIKNNFTCGTVGYYLNVKDVSNNFDSFLSSKPYFLADDWSIYSSFIKVKHLRPFAVFENYKNMMSTIESGRAEKVKEAK
ncbi:glycosyltransferase family 25 protein [Aeromonas veronii]|uniref:glycosyltransferase family 25 protein n=1 Tax=Aeromonas veronii TaxID=654 RepID=UPI0038D2C46A